MGILHLEKMDTNNTLYYRCMLCDTSIGYMTDIKKTGGETRSHGMVWSFKKIQNHEISRNVRRIQVIKGIRLFLIDDDPLENTEVINVNDIHCKKSSPWMMNFKCDYSGDFPTNFEVTDKDAVFGKTC